MRKMIDPGLATRLSTMFVNQRLLVEASDTEKRMAQMEQLLERLLAGDKTVVPFKKASR
jgi:hypothetical protein